PILIDAAAAAGLDLSLAPGAEDRPLHPFGWPRLATVPAGTGGPKLDPPAPTTRLAAEPPRPDPDDPTQDQPDPHPPAGLARAAYPAARPTTSARGAS